MVEIRPAGPEDVALIATLVRELAAYEKLADAAVAEPDDFATALFGVPPRAHALILELDAAPVGFAIYFYNFSTFAGRPGLYLEDLYIRPEFRRRGFGRAVFRHLARIAVAEGCRRVDWAVLDWNEPAIKFYTGLGAKPTHGWIGQRLSGPALEALARE